MQKKMNKTVLFSLVLGLFLSLCVPMVSAADSTDSYALLVQQSPADAGSVTPGSGVHEIQIGQTVSLTAIPKPGYRFLYWLGDVSASGTPDTTIQVNSPKMVVAVFSREAFEEELPGVSLIKGAGSAAAGGGGGRIVGTPISTPAAVNPGAYSYYNPGNYIDNRTITTDNNTDQTYDDTIPVPGEKGEQTPEPATILMLGLGSIAALKRNRK